MIIDGKAIAAQVKASLQGSDAKLAVIMVGDDPASSVYVRNKERACAEVGIRSCSRRLPATASTKEVIASIAELSAWADGILVQLPLPEHIDEKKVLGAIPPEKDVDCFHPYNIGKLLTGEAGLRPCTPAGILHLLGDVSGKHCVIIGRSNIVGKPLALMLLHANATVTVCHSKTKDLASYTRQADVLISAVGKPRFITADMVKPGAVVTVQSTPKAYGHCSTKKIWKSENDGQYEINIGAEFLNRPSANTAATMCHEMVHLYCLVNEIQDTCQKGRYHNKTFKAEAEARDLEIGYDRTVGFSHTNPTEAFKKTLEDNGFVLEVPFARVMPEEKAKAEREKPHRYVCPVCGQEVKTTADLSLICGICEVAMERAD